MRDFDLEQQLIDARRRRYGEQAQTQAPQGRMVGGRFVAPHALEYLAAGLRGFGGIRGQQMAEDELRQLQTARQQAVADALRGFNENMQGAPEQVIPNLTPMDDEGNLMPQAIKPAQPQNMPAAYQALMQAPDTNLRQMGMQGMTRIPELQAQKEEKQAQRDFQRQQAELQNQQRIEQLQIQHQMRMDALAAQNVSREQMAQAQREFQKEMIALRSSVGASSQPYFQPVQTAQGVMAFNARTGRLEPISVNGAPVVGAAADPNLQGAIAGAKTTATEQAKGTQEARGEARKADMFLRQLDQAEAILKRGPTQSGAGAAVDAAGRLVGVSTPGAQRAGQLEALSGWLVANVPRMEGPQSNFDVQNYMMMAGKIGDRTVPVGERLAALNEVRRLQEKYRESAQQRSAQGEQPAPQPARPRIRYDLQGNVIP